MRRVAEALRRGQVDLRTALITGAAGLALSCVTTVSGVVWTKYNAAEDQRREVEQLRRDRDRHEAILASLPVEQLRTLPATVEQIRAASDEMRGSVGRLESMMRGVRPASGKRP